LLASPGGLLSTAKRCIQPRKSDWNAMCRLAAQSRPGGSSSRNPKMHEMVWDAWRLCIAHQAVSGKFPEIRKSQMKQ